MDSTPCPSPRIERFYTPASTFSTPTSPPETASRTPGTERFYTPTTTASPTPFYTPASHPHSPTPPPLALEMPSSIAVSDVLRVWEEEMGETPDRPASEIEREEETTPRASQADYSPTPSTQILSRFPTSSPPFDPTSQLPSHLESQPGPSTEPDPTSERLSERLPSGAPQTEAFTDLPVFSDPESLPSPSPSPLLHDARPTFTPDVPGPIKGFHVSSDGGLPALTSRASSLLSSGTAHGIQCFTGSPRRHRIPAYGDDEVRAFRQMDRRWWTLHANHTTNLASADAKTAGRGMAFVAAEMEACNRLGIPTLCVHLGSDVGATDDRVVVARVARALRELLATVPRVTLALENMIRTSVCRQPWSLRTLARILDAVRSPRLKVCVDVCHAYIAEFDLASSGLADMLDVLEHKVGWHRVAGVHVSDSATPHGSKCEGHANIGDGLIPLHAFRSVLRSPLLGAVPYYLETPAYSPARPAYYPAIGAWEARRRVAEWDFLECLVCMPSAQWSAGERDQVVMYRRERERCEMAIRNLLRGEMGGVVDAGVAIQQAFREMRREGRVRAARIRWVREKRDGWQEQQEQQEQERTPTKRHHSDYYAGLEAAASSPSSFTTLGGYTLRRRVKAEPQR
ncbi:hypothetical protein CspeluHIS016_0603440 [Cutaneotrichosporon spelunceum]|uniref:Xylose isomerase-like TIM barrel domain-containing protein n=1 Tax=Cutaneotrichosporon spelunceum TaxID=1672016 RepID=A0AAD3TYT7_9TREE|nr:hypothetical protein CspeluHIS016_0603440 [Cutaneotrichosporon spelunceum]